MKDRRDPASKIEGVPLNRKNKGWGEISPGGKPMRTRIAWIALLALCSASAPTRGAEKGAAFQPPRVLSTVEAAYPATSIQGGTVVLEVTVSASGVVGDIQVVQGANGFTREAIEAIKKWKFAAATFEGKPVAASLSVAFSFSQPIVWWTRQKN
jgi:periplasmic protein TonB